MRLNVTFRKLKISILYYLFVHQRIVNVIKRLRLRVLSVNIVPFIKVLFYITSIIIVSVEYNFILQTLTVRKVSFYA
jgi:hypothetical protein